MDNPAQFGVDDHPGLIFSGHSIRATRALLSLLGPYKARAQRGILVLPDCRMVLILVLLVPETLVRHMSPIATGVLAWIAVGGGLVWLFAAPLVLRSEIKSLYQRSWGISLPISLLLTSFFSALYLNYSVPDLAVAPSSETVPKKG
jgi:hypothetical protein